MSEDEDIKDDDEELPTIDIRDLVRPQKAEGNGAKIGYHGMNESFEIISYDWDMTSEQNMDIAVNAFNKVFDKVNKKKR